MKKIQVWSHVAKEYLMPTSFGYKAKPKEIVYPRVSIAAVFNGKLTLFGVSIQHTEDNDNKRIGHEIAVENALIKPMCVLHSKQELSTKEFHRWARSIFNNVFENLKPHRERTCEYIEAYLNSPCDVFSDEDFVKDFDDIENENCTFDDDLFELPENFNCTSDYRLS